MPKGKYKFPETQLRVRNAYPPENPFPPGAMIDLTKEYERVLELVLGPKGEKADPEVVRGVIERILSSPTASSGFKPLEDWVKASGDRELEEFFRLRALEKGLLSEEI